MTLELLDGNLISPMSIFDVLDTVEEYLGTEVRQYLEEYIEDGEPESVSLDEHYLSVLESVSDIAGEIVRYANQKQVKREEIKYQAKRIREISRREIEKSGKEGL